MKETAFKFTTNHSFENYRIIFFSNQFVLSGLKNSLQWYICEQKYTTCNL